MAKDTVHMEFASEEQARAFYVWATSKGGFDTISKNIVDVQLRGHEDIPQCLGAYNEMDDYFFIEIE